MATTLDVEKMQSDLTKRQEKMTNAPVRAAASEPVDTSQHWSTHDRNEESRMLNSNCIFIIS